MKLQHACNGGEKATRSRRRHYAPTAATSPQDDSAEMDELANEAGPDRPTGGFALAKDSLGSVRQLRGERCSSHATA
jgi:hypothetical protein